MKRYIRSNSSEDALKSQVYDAVASYYTQHEDEILDDYEDYKHKYDLYDCSFLDFLEENRTEYFSQAVVNAVRPEEAKRAMFLLSSMDIYALEDLLY